MTFLNARYVQHFKVLGSAGVAISGEDQKHWTNGIFENSYAHCKFVMHRNFKKDRYEFEMASCDYRARLDGLKFRKISAKTFDEAFKKLANWVEKNEKFFMPN
jgi:hypothetical protein